MYNIFPVLLAWGHIEIKHISEYSSRNLNNIILYKIQDNVNVLQEKRII